MTDVRDLPRIPRRQRARPVRIAVRISYDGAGFRGFQRQPGQRTVEGALVDALLAIGLSGGLSFASRTDAGVHARGQVLAFRAPSGDSIDHWVAQLAARLPPDIAIVASATAPKGFHPRWSATGKHYTFDLARPLAEPDWRFDDLPPFDPSRLGAACRALAQAPSLAGFTAAGAPDKGAPPLTDLALDGERLHFRGPAFRRYAIRHMVGALVHEASGVLPPGSCTAIAAAAPPYRGVRAPAGRLTLQAVHYPPELDPFAPGRLTQNG